MQCVFIADCTSYISFTTICKYSDEISNFFYLLRQTLTILTAQIEPYEPWKCQGTYWCFLFLRAIWSHTEKNNLFIKEQWETCSFRKTAFKNFACGFMVNILSSIQREGSLKEEFLTQKNNLQCIMFHHKEPHISICRK